MRARRAMTIVAAVIAVAIPGVAVSAGTANAAITARPAPIAWVPCVEDATVDCGTLSVPIDWARPGGPRVDLALARRKATDPSKRIGSLVVNPGGPGGSGVGFIQSGAGFFSDELRSHFDLVGFDPRGVARSHPVVCSLDLLVQHPSPLLTSQADFDRAVAYNQRLGADCRRRTGPLFDHVDTLSVVRDLDAIRAAVGDEKLTYYGVSYGTLIGQEYAELFPHNIRELVIDSNMDHSLGAAAFLYTEAATAQDSFNEFVRGCGADPRCALYGRDIRALWNDLLARADRGELHAPGDPTAVITAVDLINEVFSTFYSPAWFDLAEELAAIDAGSPSPTVALLRGSSQARGAADATEVAEYPLAVFCEDWNVPVRDYREYAAHARVMNRIAPDMRYSPLALTVTVACQGWPARVNNPQHPLRVQGAPTLFMVNALHDPATGYAWGVNAAAQLGRQVRYLTYEGWGHAAYRRGDCVTGAVDAYLVSGALPAPGARCAAVPPQPDGLNAKSVPGLPLPVGPRPGVHGWR